MPARRLGVIVGFSRLLKYYFDDDRSKSSTSHNGLQAIF